MLIGSFLKNTNREFRNRYFSGLSFNSADCKKDYIFFAIKGTKSDGSKFIDDAIKKGATTIVSEQKFEGIKNNILFLRSNEVRKLLSELAYRIKKDKPKNIIAVTGTNGKSSIADFYFQLLNLSNKKVASIGTLGVKTKNNLKKISNTTLDPIRLSKILNDLKKKRIDNVILEASNITLSILFFFKSFNILLNLIGSNVVLEIFFKLFFVLTPNVPIEATFLLLKFSSWK